MWTLQRYTLVGPVHQVGALAAGAACAIGIECAVGGPLHCWVGCVLVEDGVLVRALCLCAKCCGGQESRAEYPVEMHASEWLNGQQYPTKLLKNCVNGGAFSREKDWKVDGNAKRGNYEC